MILILLGLCGGFFSAFFGIGGGVVAVPLMLMVLHYPSHRAVGNSSALIVVSSLAGTLAYIYHGQEALLPPGSLGYVNVPVALIVAPVTIIAARFGVRISSRLSHHRLVQAFALLLVIVGVKMIISALP